MRWLWPETTCFFSAGAARGGKNKGQMKSSRNCFFNDINALIYNSLKMAGKDAADLLLSGRGQLVLAATLRASETSEQPESHPVRGGVPADRRNIYASQQTVPINKLATSCRHHDGIGVSLSRRLRAKSQAFARPPLTTVKA